MPFRASVTRPPRIRERSSLITRSQVLTSSLLRLHETSSSLSVQIPPEIIEYVETGRNPDIYTREFVELVQRQNAMLKAKSDALAAFRDVLGDEIATAWPNLRKFVKNTENGETTGEGGNITNGGIREEEERKENGV